MSDAVPTQYRPTDSVGRFLYVVTRWLAVFGGLLFTAMAIMMTASVLGRWLFATPVKGDFELVTLGAGVAIFAFMPYCQLMRENIVVDFFLNNASVRTRAVCDSIGYLLYGAIIVLMSWRTTLGGYDMAANTEQTTALEIPLWVTFPWAVACLVLLTVVCVYTLVRAVREARLNRLEQGEG